MRRWDHRHFCSGGLVVRGVGRRPSRGGSTFIKMVAAIGGEPSNVAVAVLARLEGEAPQQRLPPLAIDRLDQRLDESLNLGLSVRSLFRVLHH